MTISTHSQSDPWKALADPNRRQILDLLREKPSTTGALAAHFQSSRFAVMKHLKVLTEAGLVTVARKGRERWNHLNPVPFREIYRRWMEPFAAPTADALLRLRDIVESSSQTTQASPEEPPMTETLSSLSFVLEIPIDAPRERVWQALVEETGKWWPASFYAGGGGRNFIIEPKLGGRVYEDWGDGQGLIWSHVIGVRKNELLHTCGDSDGAFGGPSRGHHKFVLEDRDGGGTTLKVVEESFGKIGDGTKDSLEEGWKLLFADCMKPWIESGKQPERPETVEV